MQILQPGVGYKSVSYKKAYNIALQSSSKHEEITLSHECIFAFICYFNGADLLKNIAKSARFQKEIIMEDGHIEGELSIEGF